MGARRVHCGDIFVGHICARAKGKYAENNAMRHCAGGHMRAHFPLASAIMKTNFYASSPDTEALIPSELNNEVNYRLTAAYAQQMQDGVQEILASYGYPDCEIDLLTDIDEQDGIFIKKANIILPGGAVLKEAAVEKLQDLLGDAVIDIRTGSTS
jgi:hypothetical protein